MLGQGLRTLWAEPRPPDPPRRLWRDWALFGMVVLWSLVEAVVRDDLSWRPVVFGVSFVIALALLWRRTHPLPAVVAAFGTVLVFDAARLVGFDATGLVSIAALLVLPYSLFRWGGGREAAIGLGVILAWLGVTHVADPTAAAEVVAGYGFFLFSAAFGASIRYHAKSRVREIEEAKLRERNLLARELHDTVGHYVSAIAIQAQAGRALAASHPEGALAVLETIEDAASRTLEEMRALVAVLRDTTEADLAPRPGVADIARLARNTGSGLRVDVQLTGRPEGLTPPVSAALYRIAQESVTNAVRHARNATHVVVWVTEDDQLVRVRVYDDGATTTTGQPRPGFGLLGMTERVSLLGGVLSAGPRPEGGWSVDAMLPKARHARDLLSQEHDRVMTVRVLVADDQDIVRTGLVMILEAQPGIDVVGEAADGREAVDLARRLRPDVCLLGIRMPEMDGIEATRQLAGPGVADPLAVVVITTFDLDEYVHGALKAGARGFLLKGSGPELLTQAIHAAADGDALIAPSITARLLAAFADTHAGVPLAQLIEPLTSREEEILILVAAGRTNSEIADQLYIGISTVKTHLSSLMRKLGARNRVEIAMWAYETGRLQG